MPLNAGKPTLGGDVSETRAAADGVEPGDAVMINAAGEMEAADTEAGDLAGVAREGSLHLSGPIVAAAAAGVEAGDRVDAGNATGGTTGVLDSDPAGPAVALSDEGGTWHGEGQNAYDVPDGYVVVHL